MNNNTQEIYRERLEDLMCRFSLDWEDVEFASEKIGHELWGCFSDLHIEVGGRKHRVSDLILWVRFVKEKLGDASNTLHMLQEEIDDIEEDLSKYEVNHADGEGMLPLP